MTEFTIQIAAVAAQVCTRFDSTREHCRHYLTDKGPDFSVTVESADLILEQNYADRTAQLEQREPHRWPEAILEQTALQRKIAEALFAYDTIVFHGSCVAVDGEGYLFTAKSGTGKSTHTRLWREVFGKRAVMVNDDKPFLKITDTGVTVFGSPWNGKHGLGSNISVPLKAICILERGAENRICPLEPKDAVAMLFQQSNRPRNPAMMPKYMDLIDRLSQHVPFYRLECNMDPQAAQVAYCAMSGKEDTK